MNWTLNSSLKKDPSSTYVYVWNLPDFCRLDLTPLTEIHCEHWDDGKKASIYTGRIKTRIYIWSNVKTQHRLESNLIARTDKHFS